MRTFIERLKSRKLIMAFIAAVAAFLKVLYPDIPEDAVRYVLYACLGYATVEGVIDAVYALGQWLAKRHASKCPDCLDDEAVQEQITKGR